MQIICKGSLDISRGNNTSPQRLRHLEIISFVKEMKCFTCILLVNTLWPLWWTLLTAEVIPIITPWGYACLISPGDLCLCPHYLPKVTGSLLKDNQYTKPVIPITSPSPECWLWWLQKNSYYSFFFHLGANNNSGKINS